MTSSETVGLTVKRLRKEEGLTQEQLADRVRKGGRGKCSHVTISEIERGKANPSIEMICSLAEALGVDLIELFGIKPTGEGRGWTPSSNLSGTRNKHVDQDVVTQIRDILQSAGFPHQAVAHILDTVELWQKVENMGQ